MFRKYKAVLNWGTTENALENIPNVLNKPSAVAKAVNKITTFNILQGAGINVPKFWTVKAQVERAKKEIILSRSTVSGSSGEGITIVRHGDQLPDAQLYVSYVPKSAEYRVHVFKDNAIFVQQKRAKEGVERTPDQNLIRSHGNGYVFAENEVTFPSEEVKSNVKDQAIRAVGALGLDFGAVDIIVGKKDNKVFVLEINTRPGLESTALKAAYATAIGE